MKKYRYRKAFQRALSAFLCLSMVLSLFVGTGLTGLYSVTKSANAEDSPTGTAAEDTYPENETLLSRWEDPNYLSAARPLYACRDNSFGGVEFRTIFHVFAFEGDTICIGSSVADSKINMDFQLAGNTAGNDKGSVDVVMTDLNGVKHAIDIRYKPEDGDDSDNFVPTGFIENPGVEFAALNMQKVDGKFIGKATFNGTDYEYTPYTYTVTETGVYTFEFHSYKKTGDTAIHIPRNDINMPSSANGHKYTNSTLGYTNKDIGGWIAALDITVFDESGAKQHGRTYADFLSLEMGDKLNHGVRDAYYILTTDSYIYKMQFNNVSPYTYNFFANNTGIYDTATNQIIYKSVKSTANNLSNDESIPKMGAYFKYPGTKDTELNKSYYIFLEYPDDDLYGHLYERAVQPDPAKNIRFVDEVEYKGKEVPGAYEGMGGYFAFDVEEATTATLRLEFHGNLEGKNYAPVEISGVVTPHTTNYFYWDGKDGNGQEIPAGTYTLDDIVYTVTTKAGEIHFPIIDMETARGGITFERMSHIYSKDGVQLDTDKNIYGLTKNLIYYDDSAIYYGENIASVGISENQVTLALNRNDNTWKNVDTELYNNVNNAPKTFFEKRRPEDEKQYWTYYNMTSNGGEYKSRKYLADQNVITSVDDDSTIRVGDHSHTTNVVNYFDSDENVLENDGGQGEIIKYLNSEEFPVGLSTGSGVIYKTSSGIPNEQKYQYENVTGGQSTTDYGIANYWTFIPSKPERSTDTEETITIVANENPLFNLIGRVFYDADDVTDGKGYFSDMNKTGEYLMNNVTVNLYKKVAAGEEYDATKTYVDKDGNLLDSNSFTIDNAYVQVGTGKTANGSYTFSGLEYDKVNGTEYLYQVIKPNESYKLTTENRQAAQDTNTNQNYYYYANYTYGKSYTGTEIQIINVGGDGIDPTHKPNGTTENPNNTVCAVDVGYHYAVQERSLMLKKDWDVPEDPTDHTVKHPDTVVYEVDYKPASGDIGVYEYFTMSNITSWQYEDEYLPDELNGAKVEDYFVAAEYYIDDGKIYKHTFKYDNTNKKYHSFVGEVYSAPLTELNSLTGTTVKNFSNIPDLSVLSKLTWTPVADENETYRAVLDRNVGSDKSTITITNADDPGTIEIFKYSGENKEENALQGATFRIYELEGDVTLEKIKQLASSGNTEDLKTLQGYQVGSGTTRANGRIAFPGLDPNGTYVIREVTPPAGYRILNEFYEVKPYVSGMSPDDLEKDKANGIYYFNSENYIQVDVGNAPADSNFRILKRIEGRAWQSNDSFSFSITNAFDRSEAATSWNAAKGVQIETSDLSLLYGTNQEEALDKAEEFAKHFQTSTTSSVDYGDKIKVEVKNSNDYYNYKSNDINGKEHTYTYPDRKMSDPLLKDGKITTTNPTEGRPTFRDVEFPFAGTYTFTITEDDFAAETEETLTKSDREYTVTITVKRVRNTGSESDSEDTEENSHLEAEVSSITYKDEPTGVSQIFAGSSPLFTNIYAPAPAKQDTSYNIVKKFTGRPDTTTPWLSTDKFTIRVSGVDTETQNAIKNSNLVIDGFNTALVDNGTTKEWVHTFTKNAHDKWDFKSFTFNDIMFPVQYVYDDGTVWTPPAGSEQTVPTEEEIKKYTLKPETVPVTYWLKIAEDIPTDTNGVVYDDHVYYLKIVLTNVNTEETDPDKETNEEEDGIIDEIDMYLYHVDGSVKDVTTLEDDDIVATCHTEAEVLDEGKWKESVTVADPTNESYAWFYVDDKGVLYSAADHSNKPDNAKILVRRHETHKNTDGTDGHTMTINNEYKTSCTWQPQVKKDLEGRDWLAEDKFTFTITADSDNPVGCDLESGKSKNITIKGSDTVYQAAFDVITFTQPGNYKFTITEFKVTKKEDDTEVTTKLCSYEFTVTLEDDTNGHLKLSYNVPASAVVSDDVFTFTNTYNGVDFDLNITKQLIGREWGSGEEFTFNITPDSATKTAIEKGIIKLPVTFVKAETSDEFYTVTVDKDNHTKELGEIQIINTGEITTEKEYKFTISEVTDSFTDMYCRNKENKAELVITVKSTVDTTGTLSYENTLSATYTLDGKPVSPVDKDHPIDVPFVNVATGTLTVGKKVVTSTSADETEFEFKVEFTYDETSTTDVDHVINAYKNTTKITPDSGSDNVFTFKLKDGEEVVFSSIPPNTEYKITETIPSAQAENYMLLRVCESETDNGTDIRTESKGNSVSGTINPDSNIIDKQYRLFVNGLIKRLPSAGGAGIGRYIFFGAALTIGGLLILAVLYSKCKKRREISE